MQKYPFVFRETNCTISLFQGSECKANTSDDAWEVFREQESPLLIPRKPQFVSYLIAQTAHELWLRSPLEHAAFLRPALFPSIFMKFLGNAYQNWLTLGNAVFHTPFLNIHRAFSILKILAIKELSLLNSASPTFICPCSHSLFPALYRQPMNISQN